MTDEASLTDQLSCTVGQNLLSPLSSAKPTNFLLTHDSPNLMEYRGVGSRKSV